VSPCTPGPIRSPGARSLKSTVKTEQQACIELGRLLKEASGRHYTASQLLAGGFDLRNIAAPSKFCSDH
jgi:hypothetical protein